MSAFAKGPRSQRSRRGRARWDDPVARLGPRPVADDTGAGPYAVAFGFFVFLLLLAISVHQVSSETSARKLLMPLIATLTDIDIYIPEMRDDLRQLAQVDESEELSLPGYPLPVTVTRDEALEATDRELQDVILERSFPLVYRDGLQAFDQTGDQSISAFSSDGLLEFAIERFTSRMHDFAGYATPILAVIAGLAFIAVLLKQRGMGRLRAPAGALLVAGIFGLAATFGARWLIGSIWSGDLFSDAVAETLRSATDVAIRNFATVAGLGLVLGVAAWGLGLLARVLAPGPSAAWEPAYPYVIGGAPGDDTPPALDWDPDLPDLADREGSPRD